MKRNRNLILACLAALAVAGLLATVARRTAAPSTAAAGSGPAAPAPGGADAGNAQRIVSLAPSITEVLFALGVGDRVVGVTRYCDYPPAAAERQKVGGYYDANLEAVAALDPHLVILLKEHESVRTQLSSLGVRLLPIDNNTVASILDAITLIGDACGAAARASAMVNDLESRIRRIRERTAGAPRPRVLISIGRNMGAGSLTDVYIAGQDGFFSTLLDMAGGVNVYSDRVIKFPMVSEEGIIELDPDVVIDLVADLERTGVSTQQVLDVWTALGDVKAVRNGKVHIFTEDYVTVPGPRFILLLEKMARALHPEIDLAREDRAGRSDR